MHIDWFTFFAQIVNFLVLVALLKWLLYGPIVRAMRQREERIADRLEAAQQKQREAEEKIQQYDDKTRQFDEQRQELFSEARREAREEYERLLRQSRQDVDRQRDQWREAHRQERDEMLADLRQQVAHMGLEAARRTIAELADVDLEQRMLATFTARIQELDDEHRAEIRRQLGNGSASVWIRSAFDVADPWRERLRQMVRENFGSDAEVSFERSDDLICGVEMDVGGFSFGWNAKEFLHDIELTLGERLKP